jgi:hypothetical protein
MRVRRRHASVRSKTRRVRAVFGALMLVMLLASLDQTIVSTALPTIVGDFGQLAHLTWIVNCLSPRNHRCNPALRQTGGSVRPQDRSAERHPAVSRWLCALRAQPVDDRARRFPCLAGPRRRRADGDDGGGGRRHLLAARARPVSGYLRRRVRDRVTAAEQRASRTRKFQVWAEICSMGWQ